jgi:hypothetical protein
MDIPLLEAIATEGAVALQPDHLPQEHTDLREYPGRLVTPDPLQESGIPETVVPTEVLEADREATGVQEVVAEVREASGVREVAAEVPAV